MNVEQSVLRKLRQLGGATAYGMLKQAKRLVRAMKENHEYDYFGAWKVLTLSVGSNDLCSCCRWGKNFRIKYKPENYLKKVTKALDYLHERVPKMFINLVNTPDVTILKDLSSLKCDVAHLIGCKCGTVYGKAARRYTKQQLLRYHKLLRELINSGRYDTRDDFTVVIQPFFEKTKIPRTATGAADSSFFAPDCSHISGKAHAAFALALWNGMLEPVGYKSEEWKAGERFKCPSENYPYFFTSKNSKTFSKTKVSDNSEEVHSYVMASHGPP